jgi:hypothetical protein
MVALASGAQVSIVLYPIKARGKGCPLPTGEVQFRPLVLQDGFLVATDVGWFDGKLPADAETPPMTFGFMWHCGRGHGNSSWR